MKSWFLVTLMAAVMLALAPSVAEAKRFGGGFSKGMQRSTPAPAAPKAPPSAAPTNAAGGAAAAAGGRSWMGPIAGLAAGLGIAALFSHLGLGEELANFMMIALLVLAAFMLYRWFARRSAGGASQGAPQMAAAGGQGATRSPLQALQPAPARETASAQPAAFTGLQIGSGLPGAGQAPVAHSLPAGFDQPAFERLAKMIFIRMQAANDAADVNDLRAFTTPELFADLRLDLQERGPSAQHTDVVAIEAEVLDFAEEGDQQIVSVHYQGKVREAEGEEPVDIDEVWHLVKPADDSRNWAIAGIQQRH
jgi:predicted lipid-binding transport protein (Tim44 family)